MPKRQMDAWPQPEPDASPPGVFAVMPPTRELLGMASTVGVIAAGVALIDVALIPGMVIGGAAVLVPNTLSGLRRRLSPMFDSASKDRVPPRTAAGLKVKQAAVKTITFRIIVTSLDFTTNYLVIGELATAAGLSTFALVVGPLVYFMHESAWNYFGSSVGPDGDQPGISFQLPSLPSPGRAGRGRFTISRAVSKTITFRTIATALDFTTNYVVVGDLATAVTLSATGFVLGPFVYLGHEMAWDRWGSPQKSGSPTVVG